MGAKSYLVLIDAYGEHALTQKICEGWLKHIKSGNFDVKSKKRSGRLENFGDTDLQALEHKKIDMSVNVTQSTIFDAYMYWEIFQRKKNGFHINWGKNKLKGEVSVVKVYLSGRKEKNFFG